MQDRPSIIELEDVELTFGDDAGVHSLNLRVPEGTIFGLIGPSGSGKTTTLRLMTGVYGPQRGRVQVLGRAPTRFGASRRERIGYMPQLFALYPNLTVWENLNFVASLYGLGYIGRRRRLRELLDFVELRDAAGRLGSQLSGGMQRRLALAASLVHEPLLLFADEPTAGIDPVLRTKFWDYFRLLRDRGRTLFVTTQYVGEAAYCDLVGVMREGRLIHVDTPRALRRSALGGEVIKVAVAPARTVDAAEVLIRQPAVADVRRSRGTPGLLFVYVDQAAAALPSLIQSLTAEHGITVETAEEYLPPFDDIFVALMERADGSGAPLLERAAAA